MESLKELQIFTFNDEVFKPRMYEYFKGRFSQTSCNFVLQEHRVTSVKWLMEPVMLLMWRRFDLRQAERHACTMAE